MRRANSVHKAALPKAPRPEFKKGDNLVVISGPARGKIGKFQEFRPKTGGVLVEGVNMGIKHFKPRPDAGEPGKRQETERPIHASNLLLLCPNCNEPTRVAHRVATVTRGDKTKNVSLRVCRRCKRDIDDKKS
jgi:large subunit ribosomal protein L24